MKKSYDYFKMLNLLSDCVNSVFLAVLENRDFDTYSITFHGVRSEINDVLRDDFITPINRGDILILSGCFSNEYMNILHFCDYRNINSFDCNCILDALKHSFILQNNLLKDFSQKKKMTDLLPLCRDGFVFITGCKNKIYKEIYNTVSRYGEQPLLKYIVYVMLLDIANSIEAFFKKTEWIIYNNG